MLRGEFERRSGCPEGRHASGDLDDATWPRGRGRVLSQALIVLRYFKDTNPALANYARHAIGKVLATPR